MRENANGSPTGDLHTRLADDPWSLSSGQRQDLLDAFARKHALLLDGFLMDHQRNMGNEFQG